jgi:hypothetical protein
MRNVRKRSTFFNFLLVFSIFFDFFIFFEGVYADLIAQVEGSFSCFGGEAKWVCFRAEVLWLRLGFWISDFGFRRRTVTEKDGGGCDK